MANKGNIVRWITIKGKRIPIYEDGSMGGFMEGKQTNSEKPPVDLEKTEMPVDANITRERERRRNIKALEEAKAKEEGFASVEAMKAYYEEEAGKKKEDFVVDTPIKDDPNYDKKRIARETADENDAYDREHKEGAYKMWGDERDNSYPSEQEMRDTLKQAGKEKFVKELSGGTERGYQAALRKVYDEHTLSEDEYRKKYYSEGEKRPDAVAVVSHKAKAPSKKEPVPETKEVLNARHAVRLEAQRPGGPNQKALETLQKEYDRAVEKARAEAKSIKVGDKEVGVRSTRYDDGPGTTKSDREYINKLRQLAKEGKRMPTAEEMAKKVRAKLKEEKIKAIRNENGSYSMGDYTISKRTGYEWVTPTNGSRISTKQKKRTGYSVAGKTFNTLSEAKAYVEELMRKRK